MEMHWCLKILLVCLMIMMKRANSKVSLQGPNVPVLHFQNFCTNSTVVRTRHACHSCGITMLKSCPLGYRQTPRSTSQDCRFYIRTASLKLPINGCSFECYRQVEVKSCCPGFWGPDCVG
ncbi:hypothetical protein D4764_0096540 [Takifugu flavidus]|uniref:Uncharacterized protein n=1 Tax=Takifugu flavidus TaxID=433684 RepID=A0A5C6MFL2_9TELE|nr:hypothetical protein D4764_0096540 [Takifugu flavidus]